MDACAPEWPSSPQNEDGKEDWKTMERVKDPENYGREKEDWEDHLFVLRRVG